MACADTVLSSSAIIHHRAQGYYALTPGRALQGTVEAIWLYADYSPPHAFERVLPSGTVEIVINLEGDYLRCYHPETMQCMRVRSPIVTGVHRQHFVIDTAQQHRMMGIGFTPAGAWQWLGISPSEFGNQHVELEAILSKVARHWQNRPRAIDHPGGKLQWLHAMLESHKLRPAHPAVKWAADQICRYPDAARVDYLAEESELSTRRFSELFTRQVGIAPKGFIRIRRFQSALASIRSQGKVDWSSLAACTGYADQSHLIREFKSFTGLTPTAYASMHPAWPAAPGKAAGPDSRRRSEHGDCPSG